MAVNTRDIVLLERELTGQVHPKVLKTLIKMSEDNHAMRQQIMALASLFDQLVNNQIVMAQAQQKMKGLLPHVQRMKAAGMEVGSDPTLTGEINEQ